MLCGVDCAAIDQRRDVRRLQADRGSKIAERRFDMAGIGIGRRATDESLFVIGVELDRLSVVGDRFLELMLVALVEGAGAQRARSLLGRERVPRQRARIKRNGSSAIMALIGGLR